MKNLLMIGNKAIARGLFEAGVKVCSSYPGTPSTEITEFFAKMALPDKNIHTEWAPNEKVAVETAWGASVAGVRSFSGMKHVGMNVAADPLMTASYTGVNGGLVIAVADDPGMHSSQNEQDSRHYARLAKVPMFEPADSQDCLDFAKMAFDISEEYDTPVLLRLSTRISHAQGIVNTGETENIPDKPYNKNSQKYVMMPAMARGRHIYVEERLKKLEQLAEKTPLNKIIPGGNIGIIASGTAYQYAREALGDNASYLRLGMVYPLPIEKIREFAKTVDKLYVLEELDDFIETHCLKHGIKVEGKSLFSFAGEYNVNKIRERLGGSDNSDSNMQADAANVLPVRPPVMCPGCPHRGAFYVFNKLGLFVSGDIGCYTLGATAPLNAMDTCLCMGASISGLHGHNKALGANAEKNSIAVIGDSTFIHSGITGLINIVYNKSNSTVVILDNSITAMTGHQHNPVSSFNINEKPAITIDLEALCRAVGVRRIATADPHDMETVEKILKTELEAQEPSVIILKRPCALLKSVKPLPPPEIDALKCKSCGVCLKIGCPALSVDKANKKAEINNVLCSGCGLCKNVCKFNAIKIKGGEEY